MKLVDNLWNDLQQIRSCVPLIHNITNFVTMDIMANSLLAIGASPVMAHSLEEMEDIVNIANSLNINIGTLEPIWVDAMRKAIIKAKEKNIPMVFDPVGAGATKYRTETALVFLKTNSISVLRGNASEIMALADNDISTKGVDSTANSYNTINTGRKLVKEFGCIVAISGKIDYVINHNEIIEIHNGDALMTKVTGMGCTLSSIIAAFLAINNDYFKATSNALALFGIAGEIAVSSAREPAL